jgi:arsenite methyltransferase
MPGSTKRPGGTCLTERGITFCGFAPGDRVVDVGCGTGVSVAFLRNRFRIESVGIDISTELAIVWAANPSIPLLRGRADCLPFSDGSIDGVLCECVLSLLEEPEQVMDEFARILRQGGYLVASDLYDRGSDSKDTEGTPPGNGCLTGMRTRGVNEHSVTTAGFEILLWEDHSCSLKELAAQLILSNGSLGEYKGLLGIPAPECAAVRPKAAVRPGYYLLVARKT